MNEWMSTVSWENKLLTSKFDNERNSPKTLSILDVNPREFVAPVSQELRTNSRDTFIVPKEIIICHHSKTFCCFKKAYAHTFTHTCMWYRSHTINYMEMNKFILTQS